MIKKLLLTIILISSVHFAQGGDNPALELPSFVITGKMEFNFPIAKKKKPELISTVSQDYFKTEFSPQDLLVRSVSDPIEKQAQSNEDTVDFVQGTMKISAGTLQLPAGAISMSFPMNRAFIHASIYGENTAAYIDNAGVVQTGGNLLAHYYTPNNAEFLPGTDLSANVAGKQHFYKMYGASGVVPSRSLYLAKVSGGLQNLMNDGITYGATLTGNSVGISQDGFTENALSTKGFVDARISGITVNGSFASSTSSMSMKGGNELNSNSFTAMGLAGFKYSQDIRLQGGISFYQRSGYSKLYLQARAFIRLAEGFTVFAEYNPSTSPVLFSELLQVNPYLDVLTSVAMVMEKKNAFAGAVKFEVPGNYEINAGVRAHSSDAHFYFKPAATKGYFDFGYSDVTHLSLFSNFAFYPGPLGRLFGEVSLSSNKNSAGKTLPYTPVIDALITYGFNEMEGITVETTVKFSSSVYADIANTKTLDSSFNLSALAGYNFSRSIRFYAEARNLLGLEKYKFEGYKLPGASLSIGAQYSW